MLNFYSFIVSLSFCGLAFGIGGEGGNSGNVLYCPKAVTQKYLFYDLWEGQYYTPHLVPALGEKSMVLSEKIDLALRRLDRLDPRRTQRYQEEAKNFFNLDQTRWVSGISFYEINDIGTAPPVPTECKVLKAAIQKRPVFPGDRRYHLQKEVWDLIDNDSRAALVLHEIVYSEMIRLGQKDSKKARQFTARLCSDFFSGLNIYDYRQMERKFFDLPSTITFHQTRFQVAYTADKPFEINLTELLAGPSLRQLTWTVNGVLPEGAHLDAATMHLVFPPVDTNGSEIQLDLKSLLTEPALGFNFSSGIGPDWLKVSSNGLLTARAPHPGEEHWRISVWDKERSTDGELVVQVEN